jgi:hypothetical protein
MSDGCALMAVTWYLKTLPVCGFVVDGVDVKTGAIFLGTPILPNPLRWVMSSPAMVMVSVKKLIGLVMSACGDNGADGVGTWQ